jgi:Predicted metal-sulfur cluster biosynthetic enzyme
MPEPIRKQETDVEPVRRSGLNSIERTVLEGEVVDVLRCIYDPEIPVNIYDLGLIYEVAVDESADARIVMTLTSPMCPVAEECRWRSKKGEVDPLTQERYSRAHLGPAVLHRSNVRRGQAPAGFAVIFANLTAVIEAI